MKELLMKTQQGFMLFTNLTHEPSMEMDYMLWHDPRAYNMPLYSEPIATQVAPIRASNHVWEHYYSLSDAMKMWDHFGKIIIGVKA